MKRMVWLLMLAACLMPLMGMTPEARKSFEAFEQRAESGDPEALYRLSAILEKGYDSIPADTARSLALLRRAAAAGYPKALNYLGYLFQNGQIVGENADSARFYIRRAADAGDLTAAHNYAYLLLNHETGRSNDTVALRYLRLAADAGLPQSQTMLADVLSGSAEFISPEIVDPDTVKAVKLYESAISKGFHDAELRLLNLMGPSWQSLDPQEALSEAVRYWNMGAPTIAVELLRTIGPSEPQTAHAYALLGHAFSRGQGAVYDHRKANEYFARAAILGNPSAQFILAETLEIFPDALKELLPDMPDSMTPESLRQSAAKAGITTASEATQALLTIF